MSYIPSSMLLLAFRFSLLLYIPLGRRCSDRPLRFARCILLNIYRTAYRCKLRHIPELRNILLSSANSARGGTGNGQLIWRLECASCLPGTSDVNNARVSQVPFGSDSSRRDVPQRCSAQISRPKHALWRRVLYLLKLVAKAPMPTRIFTRKRRRQN